MNNRRSISFHSVFVVAFVLAVVLFGVGVYLAAKGFGFAILGAGSLAVITVLVGWQLCVVLVQHATGQAKRIDDQLLPIRQLLDRLFHALHEVGEKQLLSDRAKALAYRQNDREALRRAIREDIDKQDWDAALRLTDDMEKEFGYAQEATQIRADVKARRSDLVRRQIDDGINTIIRRAEDEDWAGAHEEAERLVRLFPDEPAVKPLHADIDQRKVLFKERMLGQWHTAVDNGATDEAIELLKRLDDYLTPAEGEQLQEKARGLFKQKLADLKEKFAAAVHEHRWSSAISIGEEITAEFPNTQMAHEVRERMPQLRDHAANGTPVGV
ncbi:MAG: hypothetical protein AAF743_08805 [Planctomycetota bacterium]